MRRQINLINHALPIADKETAMASDAFRIWINQVSERGLIIGDGSPEGVVEAQQGQEYMDQSGAAGSVKYIKQLADISGDKSQGWVAIG